MADNLKHIKSGEVKKEIKSVKEAPKERKVNPIAMRPEGINVSITNPNQYVKKLSKKFGF